MTSLSQNMDLIHHSHQADFAQDLMSMICGEHRLDTLCRETLDFHYDGIRLPHKKMAIGTISYGANVAINIANLKAYSISLPFHGKQTLSIRGAKYQSDAQTGLIVSNQDLQDLVINQDCQKFQVVIPENSLQLVLSELLNQPIEEAIVFNPEISLSMTGLMQAWWHNIENFLQLKSHYADFSGLPMFSEDYENFVIKALLLSQENNYSAALHERCNRAEPAYLRKVKNFIIQHAHETLNAESLHLLAGVSKSKLYAEFQQHYGLSPMAYLRKYRLQQIYKILSNAAKHQKISISKLAYDWGFNHLSRFAQEYKDEFGEKPSETRNKHE
ncbi:AraC family transcriptional regulator [Acinetobacter proteolyticus]|uniref:AraC family transcriptional regulator n=1 Tax=Acinetobacter proteolyticus TaxID=1776741 RepID=UPI00086352F8|nr:AraC family transcriptional regulator [Acinetobacter proteolyticus]OEY93032.1 AraC family transcriptional regulator [Acinetobacter proteolyticus]